MGVGWSDIVKLFEGAIVRNVENKSFQLLNAGQLLRTGEPRLHEPGGLLL